MSGADAVIMAGLEFKEAQRPADIAAWLWTGEFPEIRARVEAEAMLVMVSPPPQVDEVSLQGRSGRALAMTGIMLGPSV